MGNFSLGEYYYEFAVLFALIWYTMILSLISGAALVRFLAACACVISVCFYISIGDAVGAVPDGTSGLIYFFLASSLVVIWWTTVEFRHDQQRAVGDAEQFILEIKLFVSDLFIHWSPRPKSAGV